MQSDYSILSIIREGLFNVYLLGIYLPPVEASVFPLLLLIINPAVIKKITIIAMRTYVIVPVHLLPNLEGSLILSISILKLIFENFTLFVHLSFQ